MLLMVSDAGFSAAERSAAMAKTFRQIQPRFAWDMSLIGMSSVLQCAKELTRRLPIAVSCSDANVMIYC